MAFIVGVFQTADHRRDRADQFTELRLGQARLGPQGENFPGYLVVRPLLFHFNRSGLPSYNRR
jgi:hypothetical protein